MVEAEAGRQELAAREHRQATRDAAREGRAAADAARPAPAGPGAGWRAWWDLVAWSALALAAGVAAFALPSGDALRMALAGLVVFVVPGVLAMEALFPPWHASPPPRRFRVAVALGLSPALVGLAALATAIVPGAFRPVNIVAAVTLTCLVLAAAASSRRARPGPEPPRVAVLSPGRFRPKPRA